MWLKSCPRILAIENQMTPPRLEPATCRFQAGYANNSTTRTPHVSTQRIKLFLSKNDREAGNHSLPCFTISYKGSTYSKDMYFSIFCRKDIYQLFCLKMFESRYAHRPTTPWHDILSLPTTKNRHLKVSFMTRSVDETAIFNGGRNMVA